MKQGREKMNTDEIIQLTRESIRDLVYSRQAEVDSLPGHTRRRTPRWPFPGTVGIHPTDGTNGQWFATCRDISETGLGMCGEHYFYPDTIVEIAIHLPEATLYGRAVVRYCQQTPSGYMTGVEFTFDH
jgi:PilZ domain